MLINSDFVFFYRLAESDSESEGEKEETDDDDDEDDVDDEEEEEEEDGDDVIEPPVVKEPLPPIPTFPAQQPIKLPSGPPPPPVGMPPAMMFRPPPLRPNMQPPMPIRMPPGPPPRSGMPRMGIRMPPGPPPGMPPNRMHHNSHHKPHTGPVGNILSAGPQLTKDTKGMTTITAKPQIRYVFYSQIKLSSIIIALNKQTNKQKKNISTLFAET